MLAVEGERSGAEYGSLEAELSSKARREFAKVKAKARSVGSNDINYKQGWHAGISPPSDMEP